MDETGKKYGNIALAKLNPVKLLSGKHPRLIDEWQLAPSLWDDMRFNVDRASEYGQYSLTGSSVPPKTDEMHHTGTGRIARFRMRPMSLWESGESSGGVPLGSLFSGETLTTADAKVLGLEAVAFVACRGGWPEAVGQSGRFALRHAFDYVDAVAESDISQFDGVARDAECARAIMRSYARLQGTQASVGVITAGLPAHEGRTFGIVFETLAIRDLRAYADALDGMVHHYLDRNGLGCDAVIRLRDRRYGLVEVKLGGDALIDKGCETLNKLLSCLDTSKMRMPTWWGETFNRANEMRYFRACLPKFEDRSKKYMVMTYTDMVACNLERNERCGFALVRPLYLLLDKYEADREKYKTLDDFVPVVVDFLIERYTKAK